MGLTSPRSIQQYRIKGTEVNGYYGSIMMRIRGSGEDQYHTSQKCKGVDFELANRRISDILCEQMRYYEVSTFMWFARNSNLERKGYEVGRDTPRHLDARV